MKALTLALCVALPANAYNEAIHELITRTALGSRPGMQDVLGPGDVDALRARFWRIASTNPEFRARYPDPAAFDAWEFKELLMLDPAAKVHGFDRVDGAAGSRLDVLTLASRWPDDDERNRHRYLRDAKTRAIVPGPDGQPLPFDPATLDFGSLTGTTSQGHAHYGLVEGPLSDDPEVLKKEPRRFAVPPTAHAYGREFAQLYTDLAILAVDDPALSATFAGAAFHHLEDVANQIHTVQVGIYEFFESAFLQSKLRDLKTLGGLVGERRTLKQIGLRLIANHHLVSEDLFARRVLAGGTPAGIAEDDPQIRAQGPFFGRDLTSAIIDPSSLEAADVYRLTWQFTAKSLHDGVSGHEYDGAKDDPEAYVVQGSAALAPFFALEGRGLARAVTGVRIWWDRFTQADKSGEAAVGRILALVLPYQKAAGQRRAAYLPPGAERSAIAWGYPAAAALVLAGAAWLVLRRRRN